VAHDSKDVVDSETMEGEGSDDESASKEADEQLLKEARARFDSGLEAVADERREASEDRKFRKGDQWPEEIKMARSAKGRPCLTINKMPQFEQQVTNDQRQNRPSIKVHPVDDFADVETAKVYQGIIKHIEVASSADTARDTAFENAVRGSYGYYRIVTEYTDPMSFDQDIRVKRIRNPDTVLLDPHHQEPDGSDANWAFVVEDLARDEYKRLYPNSELANQDAWDPSGGSAPGWIKSDSVRVAEYFYKEYQDKPIVQLNTGDILLREELPEVLPAGVSIVRERTASVPSIKWCKLNGLEILEKTDWPGKWIPILPVYGAEIVVDGKVIRESLIRHAKDPARMYNFWKSAETEAITLAPKAPYIADAKTIEGYEHLWENANRENYSYLPFNARSDAPAPQRQSFEPAIQAITQASMLASDEVKQTLGIYDASLGARSNETSGVAIQRRNQQAQTSNFHFTDNLNRTIRHEGRIYVDLIPKIYDTARIARIIGEDGEHKLVPINQDFQDESGQMIKHDLGAGKYDVTIDTGPSYATRRQEAASAMLELSKSIPSIGGAAPDLVIKSMDVPGATELADRLKKTLPPNLIDDPKAKQIPPQVQAQMQQMGQMIEQLTQKVHEAHDQLDQKRLELESKERIEMAKLEVQLEIERAKIDAKDSLALLNHEIASIEQRLQLLNIGQPFELEPQNQFQEPPVNPAQPPQGPEMGAGDIPTGGASPGQPMEQSSDDPNAI
jgi:hypothetical protein